MSDLFLRPLFTWRSAVASENGPENPTTRHLLLTLGLHMSEKGDSCFPSTRLLSAETGLSHKTVITHLRAASDSGWLGKHERRLSNGQGWRRVEYFALIPAGIEVFHAKQRDEPPTPREGDEPPTSRAQETGERGERGTEGGEPPSRRGVSDGSPHIYGSTSKSTPRGRARAARAGFPIPPDFGISDAIRALAKKRNYEPYLEAHLEYFLGYGVNGHDGKQPLYLDWDKAFWNSILGDWGDVRRNMKRDGLQQTKAPDTSCRVDKGGQRCGMPGRVDPVHGYACEHCKQIELGKSTGMSPEIRAQLKQAVKRAPA